MLRMQSKKQWKKEVYELRLYVLVVLTELKLQEQKLTKNEIFLLKLLELILITLLREQTQSIELSELKYGFINETFIKIRNNNLTNKLINYTT